MIHIDFDGTLAVVHALDTAFSGFIPMPEAETLKERFEARRIHGDRFKAMSRMQQIQFWLDRGGVIQEDRDGYTVVAFARPRTIEFVQACLALDPTTAILTSGKATWQWKLARRLGLPDVELYGREDFGKIPSHPHNLLVDDLGPRTAGVQEKMKALGFQPTKEPRSYDPKNYDLVYPTERHIQISPWDGKDASDDELFNLLPRIKALLP